MSYDPARFAPGTPWATHDWDDKVPMWEDSAWWCVDCGIASFHDGAHEECPGKVPEGQRYGPKGLAVLVTPKEVHA